MTETPDMSVDDAIDKLDSRLPLTYREMRAITQQLWDTALREGARMGRTAGVESVQTRLLKYAETISDNALVNAKEILTHLASQLDPPVEAQENVQEDVQEYREPTTTIRERLTEAAKRRDEAKHQ